MIEIRLSHSERETEKETNWKQNPPRRSYKTLDLNAQLKQRVPEVRDEDQALSLWNPMTHVCRRRGWLIQSSYIRVRVLSGVCGSNDSYDQDTFNASEKACV